MTEQKETTKPTKPLTLSTTARSGAAAAKGGGETQVRQKFSHGRTRAVTVEVKKPVKRPAARRQRLPAPTPAPAAERPGAGRHRPHPEAGRRRRSCADAGPRERRRQPRPSGARSTLSPRPAGQAVAAASC